MNTYPTTPIPNIGSTKGLRKESLRTESEGGYLRSRPKYTIGKRPFMLEYSVITDADYDTLETFFNANQGSNFLFTYPDGTQITACFVMDEIISKSLGAGLCSTSIQLREV